MSYETIRDAFVVAGYEFVPQEPPMSDARRGWRPDVVAWAADINGTLVPWAAVEMKKASAPARPEVGLAALARSRDLLGTTDHYVVVDGTDWYRADPGIQRLVRVDGPEPPPYGGHGEIADVDFAVTLLSDELWKAADRNRGRAPIRGGHPVNPEDFLKLAGFRTHTGTWVPIRKETLWQARRRALVDFERRGREGELFTSHKTVARAVAELAGAKLTDDLLDPFCGAGSFLWDSIEHAERHGTGLSTVRGYDLNQRTADVARSIADVAPIPVEIIAADALQTDVARSACVVSAPPFGLKFSDHHELLDGSKTRDGDLVVLDRILRLLKAGGRAVLHLPLNVAFRANAEPYRRYIATNFRVAAILGLPVGAVPGASVRTVLLVIDVSQAGDTFVAQLGEDWETQLAPDGAALEAALKHIDGEKL
ncbi:SAM-dependent methyltransferase [Allocatelliglobosispora scoriae]|uniref:site-specific DNA-methyltransferase (adenine-specific) n=1 Tax=Allocatelliglobosispora scoriae TaxID=643052 RepID=A0A841BP41_9ACTN|nr:N-6 DNA methylase [Allocatelliglobosispora scoriae]MBB5868580.1 SAM-dependent methyltransferase [Allocatelliglobosispora scoriae]